MALEISSFLQIKKKIFLNLFPKTDEPILLEIIEEIAQNHLSSLFSPDKKYHLLIKIKKVEKTLKKEDSTNLQFIKKHLLSISSFEEVQIALENNNWDLAYDLLKIKIPNETWKKTHEQGVKTLLEKHMNPLYLDISQGFFFLVIDFLTDSQISKLIHSFSSRDPEEPLEIPQEIFLRCITKVRRKYFFIFDKMITENKITIVLPTTDDINFDNLNYLPKQLSIDPEKVSTESFSTTPPYFLHRLILATINLPFSRAAVQIILKQLQKYTESFYELNDKNLSPFMVAVTNQSNYFSIELLKIMAENLTDNLIPYLQILIKNNAYHFFIVEEILQEIPVEFLKKIVKQNDSLYIYINLEDHANLFSLLFDLFLDDEEMLLLIIKQYPKVSINLRNMLGFSPLIKVISIKPSIELIKPLLKKGASPHIKSYRKNNLLHLLASQSIQDDECLHYLIKLGQIIINEKNHSYRTPLEIALQQNQVHNPLIIKLIENGADLSPSQTPCLAGQIFQFIFENLEMKSAQGVLQAIINHLPPYLTWYILRFHSELIINFCYKSNLFHKLLPILSIFPMELKSQLKQFPKILYDQIDAKGNSPLVNAINAQLESVVRELVKAGADISKINDKGFTLLHYAAQLQKTPILDFLLQQQILDINHQNRYGNTPLHQAFKANQKEACQKLIAYGANPLLKNNNGTSFIDLLIDKPYSNLEVIKELFIQLKTKLSDAQIEDHLKNWSLPMVTRLYNLGEINHSLYLISIRAVTKKLIMKIDNLYQELFLMKILSFLSRVEILDNTPFLIAHEMLRDFFNKSEHFELDPYRKIFKINNSHIKKKVLKVKIPKSDPFVDYSSIFIQLFTDHFGDSEILENCYINPMTKYELIASFTNLLKRIKAEQSCREDFLPSDPGKKKTFLDKLENLWRLIAVKLIQSKDRNLIRSTLLDIFSASKACSTAWENEVISHYCTITSQKEVLNIEEWALQISANLRTEIVKKIAIKNNKEHLVKENEVHTYKDHLESVEKELGLNSILEGENDPLGAQTNPSSILKLFYKEFILLNLLKTFYSAINDPTLTLDSQNTLVKNMITLYFENQAESHFEKESFRERKEQIITSLKINKNPFQGFSTLLNSSKENYNLQDLKDKLVFDVSYLLPELEHLFSKETFCKAFILHLFGYSSTSYDMDTLIGKNFPNKFIIFKTVMDWYIKKPSSMTPIDFATLKYELQTFAKLDPEFQKNFISYALLNINQKTIFKKIALFEHIVSVDKILKKHNIIFTSKALYTWIVHEKELLEPLERRIYDHTLIEQRHAFLETLYEKDELGNKKEFDLHGNELPKNKKGQYYSEDFEGTPVRIPLYKYSMKAVILMLKNLQIISEIDNPSN